MDRSALVVIALALPPHYAAAAIPIENGPPPPWKELLSIVEPADRMYWGGREAALDFGRAHTNLQPLKTAALTRVVTCAMTHHFAWCIKCYLCYSFWFGQGLFFHLRKWYK